MALAQKITKAKKLGIVFKEGAEDTLTEDQVDKMIDQKQELLGHQKQEEKARKDAEKKAADYAKKHQLVLKDVDGDDVEQAEYFWPRLEKETVGTPPNEKVLEPTDQTAPTYFNAVVGMPVDREELIETFLLYFPRKKGFLFYKMRDKEVYTIIVPLKYATTIGAQHESRPGDHQRHALSFIAEGSVNIESLKGKLERVAGHKSISTEPIAR